MTEIRRIGRSKLLPAPVGAINDSGLVEEFSPVDHQHQWASGYTELTPSGTFDHVSVELTMKAFKFGNLVQLVGAAFSTANDSVITQIPEEFVPSPTIMPMYFIGHGNGATSNAMLLELSATGVLTILTPHTTINYVSLTTVRYVYK